MRLKNDINFVASYYNTNFISFSRILDKLNNCYNWGGSIRNNYVYFEKDIWGKIK